MKMGNLPKRGFIGRWGEVAVDIFPCMLFKILQACSIGNISETLS